MISYLISFMYDYLHFLILKTQCEKDIKSENLIKKISIRLFELISFNFI